MRLLSIGSPATSRSRSDAAPPPAAECGFTLVEVLVAFVLLSIALAVLVHTFCDSTRRLDGAADWAKATLLAETALAQVGNATALGPGDRSGRFDPRYSWTETVRLASPEASAVTPLQLYQVGLTVAWEERGVPRRLQVTTLRLGPAETRR
jgi:general secretion pathway protein I